MLRSGRRARTDDGLRRGAATRGAREHYEQVPTDFSAIDTGGGGDGPRGFDAARSDRQRPNARGEVAGATHPVHIHSGTCAELGDVVFPLVDLAGPAGDATGPESAVPVTLSENIVDIPLQEMIDGGHAINVHLSNEEIDTYIACGDIGGVITTDAGGRQEMMIGLAEQNDSGYSGTVWLGPSADGAQTEVSVILLEPAMN